MFAEAKPDTTADSQYFASLDKDSQRAMEQRNLSDSATDILLMSATQFRQSFKSFLRDDVPLKLKEHGSFSLRKAYPGIQLVTAEDPSITYNSGAFPCSLVFSFDSAGNFAVIHLTRFELFMGNTHDKRDQDADIRMLERFTAEHMGEDARIVISATNLKTEMQDQVVDSIKTVFAEPEQIETLLIDGSRVFKDGDIPSGYAPSTKDHIQAVYFMPHHFTRDGKNKVILCGDKEAEGLEDSLWLIRNFNTQFEQPY